MFVTLIQDNPPLDGAAKLIEAAGKGNLAFAAFLVLVVAFIALKFFGKDATWLRVGSFVVIVACIVFVVFVLAVPTNKAAVHDPPKPAPEPKPVQLKQCSGEKDVIFTPSTPGVMQTNPDGSRVDLGDGGGGTRLQKWAYSWTAPATVTSVKCSAQRNEHVLAENKDGSTAECEGSINGGNDAITMHVVWNGPCDKQ